MPYREDGTDKAPVSRLIDTREGME